MKYSVCLTTKDCAASARSFVRSFQLEDRDVELVVVDAGSEDETRTILRQFDGPVRIETVEGCTRGEGRQRAVELARHDHLISEVDPDIRYSGLEGVLDVYERTHTDREVATLLRGNNGLLVAPTALLEKVPYRPIQYREDHSLHDRLYRADALRVVGSLPSVEIGGGTIVERVELPSGSEYVTEERLKEMSPRDRLAAMYRDAQAMYRIGFSPRQLFVHYARNLPTPLKPLAIPFTVGGVVSAADRPVYADALAHCADEIDRPLRHECYSFRD